jgi:hypothetical protein
VIVLGCDWGAVPENFLRTRAALSFFRSVTVATLSAAVSAVRAFASRICASRFPAAFRAAICAGLGFFFGIGVGFAFALEAFFFFAMSNPYHKGLIPVKGCAGGISKAASRSSVTGGLVVDWTF